MDQPALPETPQPVEPLAKPPANSTYKMLAVVLGIILILLLGIGAFLFMNNKTEIAKEETMISPTQPVEEDGVTPTPLPSSITPTTNEATVVIIESEGSLPTQDVTEIRARVINPYLDYFKETRTDDQLATFKVTTNTQVSKNQYPYLADAITKNGVNEGFVIGKTDGHITWWLPECMNGCTFSEAFKAKYPEIIAAYGN